MPWILQKKGSVGRGSVAKCDNERGGRFFWFWGSCGACQISEQSSGDLRGQGSPEREEMEKKKLAMRESEIVEGWWTEHGKKFDSISGEQSDTH